MGEKKQESSEAAKRAKPVTGRSAGRKASSKQTASGASKDSTSNAGQKKPSRAAPKVRAKKEKKAAAAKTSPSKKPSKTSPSKKPAPGSETARGSGSGKARNGKDAETLPMAEGPMAEEKSKIMVDPNEKQAERRAAGGTDSTGHVEGWPSANQATAKPEASVPETSVDKEGRGESKPVSQAARKPAADKRVKPGDSGEATPRPNTLVPTNGIHTTVRRLKRRLPQNRTIMFLVAATLLGILIIGEQTEPPDMTSVEAQIAAGQTGPARAEADIDAPGGITRPRVQNPAEGPSGRGQRVAPAWGLDDGELIEMERMLARLDLAPSRVDGIVDQRTRHAIRLYQQFAGLPVDGKPSPALLTDMREVVRLMDGGDG